MTYKLFIDDERFPVGDQAEWTIVRSFDEAIEAVKQYGYPVFCSFDHDLGAGKTGYDFAKWLVEFDLDTDSMPVNFGFYVHSQNPVGAKNINLYLERYLQTKFDIDMQE